ncbi:MAG: hypothetical protein Ct9H300mP2_3980 [Candidatus Neomarinimicrobiota bacterium]|nr:MAG: hypothetical protein Ct9H300mP2_3980 [Candidatus Neomarinimicrobiota bacterium]
MNDITIIKKIFRMRTIAVVGMSQKPERPSNFVALYMQDKGYEIIPVNPGQKEICGRDLYPSLQEIPKQVDVVNVFRRPEYVLPIAEALSEKC